MASRSKLPAFAVEQRTFNLPCSPAGAFPWRTVAAEVAGRLFFGAFRKYLSPISSNACSGLVRRLLAAGLSHRPTRGSPGDLRNGPCVAGAPGALTDQSKSERGGVAFPSIRGLEFVAVLRAEDFAPAERTLCSAATYLVRAAPSIREPNRLIVSCAKPVPAPERKNLGRKTSETPAD
jgi:hypothetical protein